MPFRFKDLVVDVAGARLTPQLCALHTCRPWFSWWCRWNTCNIFSPCGPLSPCPDFSNIVACRVATLPDLPDCGVSEGDPGPIDFESIKRSLQEQLRAVEEQEKLAANRAKPQTLAEAEDLEKKLAGALEELRAMKKTLK